MMNNLKIAALGVLAAVGLTSAAVAQQSGAQRPNMPSQPPQQTISGGMQDGQMMNMMADPQMRQQMMQMVQGCNQMMQQMGNMPAANARPRS